MHDFSVTRSLSEESCEGVVYLLFLKCSQSCNEYLTVNGSELSDETWNVNSWRKVKCAYNVAVYVSYELDCTMKIDSPYPRKTSYLCNWKDRRKWFLFPPQDQWNTRPRSYKDCCRQDKQQETLHIYLRWSRAGRRWKCCYCLLAQLISLHIFNKIRNTFIIEKWLTTGQRMVQNWCQKNCMNCETSKIN